MALSSILIYFLSIGSILGRESDEIESYETTSSIVAASNDPNHVCQCNGNGYCRGVICACKLGWGGDHCDRKVCPGTCSPHGVCEDDGHCACDDGWGGIDCSMRVCPMSQEGHVCSGNGICKAGKCECYPGFTGMKCSEMESSGVGCKGFCSGNGICRHGSCFCKFPYTGESCSTRLCPDDCNGHGECDATTKTCSCTDPYYGVSCELRKCRGTCENGGRCDPWSGRCVCKDGWGGQYCTEHKCPNDCSGKGICRTKSKTSPAVCECFLGWTGASCSDRDCGPYFTGKDCKTRRCYNNCHGPDHGICNTHANYTCQCVNGWIGESCNQLPCEVDCNGHGICTNGTCQCSAYWTGGSCQIPTCPLKCNHGTCAMTILKYVTGNSSHHHTRSYINAHPLPTSLMRFRSTSQTNVSQGMQLSQYFTNDNKDKMHLPSNWETSLGDLSPWEAQALARSRAGDLKSQNGMYIDSIKSKDKGEFLVKRECMCDFGYGGKECEHRFCPNDCSGNGHCFEGTCYCDVQDGWSGEDCSIPHDKNITHLRQYEGDCQKTCKHGKCLVSSSTVSNGSLIVKSRCVCEPLYTGLHCDVRVGHDACPKNCTGHGTCHLGGICHCDPGYFGDVCEIYDGTKCPNACSKRGVCVEGRCKCNRPWAGLTCEAKACPNQCSLNGYCDTRNWKCLCHRGFVGEDCSSYVGDYTSVSEDY